MAIKQQHSNDEPEACSTALTKPEEASICTVSLGTFLSHHQWPATSQGTKEYRHPTVVQQVTGYLSGSFIAYLGVMGLYVLHTCIKPSCQLIEDLCFILGRSKSLVDADVMHISHFRLFHFSTFVLGLA